MQRGDSIGTAGYRGTVVEVTDSIPDACLCVKHRGKPGCLVYWHYFDGGYEEVLSAEKATKAAADAPKQLQWIPQDIKHPETERALCLGMNSSIDLNN